MITDTFGVWCEGFTARFSPPDTPRNILRNAFAIPDAANLCRSVCRGSFVSHSCTSLMNRRHRSSPIVSKFFAPANVAHGYERNLAPEAEVRIARMIAVQHRRLSFFIPHRCDKQIVANLNFNWSEPRVNVAHLFARDDVPALDGNDLAFRNIRSGKQSASVNRALAHLSLRREV